MGIHGKSRLEQCDAAVAAALSGDSDAIGPVARLSEIVRL